MRNPLDSKGRVHESRGLALLVVGSLLAAACAEDPPLGRVSAALTATPQTIKFQDGSNGYEGTSDTALSQSSPTVNFGSATTVSADGDEPSGSGQDSSFLLRWDLGAIPVGSGIQSASITLRIANASSNSYPIVALLRPWSESTATWQQPQSGTSWQSAGAIGAADRATTSMGALTSSTTGTVTFALNASGIAKISEWVNEPAKNFGLVVASATNTNGLDIATREDGNVSYRPALNVTFTAPGTGSGTGGTTGTTDAAVDRAFDVAGTGGAGTGGAGTGGAGTGGASELPAVLYAAGDVGDCAETADTDTGLLLDGSTDPIALLGDIGYPNGTAADLANCFDPVWGRHKPRIHPSPGNHEYLSANAAPYFAYFGAAAGDPTKGYYSYELGAWHIVVVNSNCTNVACSAGSAQEQWLRQDLAAHPSSCTLAYWHHPLFNSGHHGNATNMKPIWQALMDFNADVVLSGHEHGYQRWKPMNASGTTVSNGITEFIAGTGGTTLVGFTNGKPANNVIRDAATPGVLKLTLRKSSFDWQFVPIAGKTFTDTGTASCH